MGTLGGIGELAREALGDGRQGRAAAPGPARPCPSVPRVQG